MSVIKAQLKTNSVWRGLSVARLQRAVRLGIRSLWLHRLRSLLTVLGIVFGVCSVIAMLAIGEGASYEAQEQIKSLGSQNIILHSVKPPDEQKVSDQGSQSRVLPVLLLPVFQLPVFPSPVFLSPVLLLPVFLLPVLL